MISGLANLNRNDFADDFSPTGEPGFQLLVEGNNMTAFTVNAWRNGAGFAMESSLNEGIYFQEEGTAIFEQVFEVFQPEPAD